MGASDGQSLLYALFYLNGLNFALRGGEEHVHLLIEQFSFEVRDGKRCLVYREKHSKTNSGGLNNLRHKTKEVVHFENVSNRSRCHVTLMELFLSKRPQSSNRFYLQPLKNPNNLCWYTSKPIGKNKLNKFMKSICDQAGIDSSSKSNHSLRATCATRLYQNNSSWNVRVTEVWLGSDVTKEPGKLFCHSRWNNTIKAFKTVWKWNRLSHIQFQQLQCRDQ